jgi:hypothetical protein
VTGISAVPGKCTVVLDGELDKSAVYYGDSLQVSGTLTRTVNGTDIPVAGASLPVKLGYQSSGTTKVASLGTAKTLADGSYSIAVKPTVSGELVIGLVESSGYTATVVELGDVVVHVPTTDLTAQVDKTDVGYGDPVVVTGRLTKTAGALTTGAVTSGVASATVSVKLTAPGKAPVTVGSGKTLADGTYRISVPLRLSGTMTVVYAGAAGLPADSVSLGSVTAGSWTSAITMSGAPYGTGFQLTGSVTKTYGGVTKPAGAVKVRVYFTPSSTGVAALVSSVNTNAAGGYAAKVYPSVSGSYKTVVTDVVGYADSTSGTFSVTR